MTHQRQNSAQGVKESDYISENIKEGLLQVFIKDNKKWISEMSVKLQQKFTKQTKNAQNVTVEAVIEIISLILTKFSEEEQDQIYIKLVQIIKNHNATTWQLSKKAIETLFVMHQKSKLHLDDKKKEELLDVFLIAAYDRSLIELSLKGMKEILNVTENPSLIDKIKLNIKESKGGDIKAEDVINTTDKLLDLIETVRNDTQFIRDVINTLFAPFLQNSSFETRYFALKTITETVTKTAGDNQLILDALKLLIPLSRDFENHDKIARSIRKLMEKVDNKAIQQLIRDHAKVLTPLILENSHNPDKIVSTINEVSLLFMLNPGNLDIEIFSEVIEKLFKVLEKMPLGHMRRPVEHCAAVFRFERSKNLEVERSMIKILISTSKPDGFKWSFSVSEAVAETIEAGKEDLQFINDAINMLSPLLESRKTDEQKLASSVLIKIAQEINTQFGQQIIDIFIPLLKNPDGEIRKNFADEIITLILKNIQLAKHAIDKMVPLSKHENAEIRKETLSNLQSIFEKRFRAENDPCGRKSDRPIEKPDKENPDSPFISELILKTFIPALQDPAWEVRDSAVINITKLIEMQKAGDHPSVIKSIVQAFIPLLQDPQSQVKKSVLDSFLSATESVSNNKDVQPFIKDIIKALIPLLKDSDDDVRNSAVFSITGFLEIESSGDTQLRRETLNELTPLFQDSANDIRESAARELPKLFTSDPQFCRDLIDLLTPSLETAHADIQGLIVYNLTMVVEKNKALTREVLDLLIPLSKDPSDPRKTEVFSGLGKLAKINVNHDPQMTQEIFEILSPVCKGSDSELKEIVVLQFGDLVNDIHDEKLLREIINHISPALQDSHTGVKEVSVLFITQAVQKIKNPESQLIRSVLESFAPLLQDPEENIKRYVPGEIHRVMEFADKNDIQLVKYAFDVLVSLLKDSDPSIITHASTEISYFAEETAPQLSRKAIEALIPHLQVGSDESKNSISESIAKLTKYENKDIAFLKEVIKAMTPSLNEFSETKTGRKKAFNEMTEIVNNVSNAELTIFTVKIFTKFFHIASLRYVLPELIEKIIKTNGQSAEIITILTPLLADSNDGVRNTVSDILFAIVKTNEETKLNQNLVIKALIPLLKDSNKYIRKTATNHVMELMKMNETQLLKEVVDNFIPLLEDSDGEIRARAGEFLSQLLTLYGNEQLVNEVLNALSPYFQHSNSDVMSQAYKVFHSVSKKFLFTLSGDNSIDFTKSSNERNFA